MAFECHWLSVKKVTNVKHHMGSILLQRFRPISIEIPTIKFNTLKPRQNGHHFPDDIFKCIFLNENVWILIKISLEFVPKGLIDNIPALVQIQAWHRSGNNKQLSEPMMVNLLAYIWDTQPQWVYLSLDCFPFIMGICASGKMVFVLKCPPFCWDTDYTSVLVGVPIQHTDGR